MKRIAQLSIITAVWLSVGTARAQTAPTCSFDEPGATLTVTLNGTAATLTRTGPGQIRLNGVACTGATVTTTDFIQVNGGALLDSLTVTGDFTPGLTAEGEGSSEIEWGFDLGNENDFARFNGTANADTVTFAAGGIDVANDGDEDITTAGVNRVRMYPLDGDDTVNASAYTGGGTVEVFGGNGNDSITGSAQNDSLFGQADNDTIDGGDGIDSLYGGQGDDDVDGQGGNDTLFAEAIADGADLLFGGDGVDTLTYSRRDIGVSVSIGNGLADDGEAGELDNVDVSVEKVVGGSGDDTLVGSASNNTLTGNAGNDELFGGNGRDILQGGGGDDVLFGESGPDDLFGDAGLDSADGGPGNDNIFGGTAADSLTGGTGADSFFGEGGNDTFFNADAFSDTVNCGVGIQDDPEPDALDTFISCENI